ncbi:hypothetical protein L0337_24045 [candidate division KSB1 bacterium]|nr:hypothetical protein [candidate division KSB1 bacterium]
MICIISNREMLVAALHARGVDYLTPSDAKLDQPIDDESLIASLAAHHEARLRQALIALFLLQPQLAPLVPNLRGDLEPRAAQELTAYYMAAMYLQAMWRTRLGYYLESFPELPDYFSDELELPKARELHGKAGLYALADWHASQSPFRFNHLSAYEGVVDLLFQRLEINTPHHEPTSIG